MRIICGNSTITTYIFSGHDMCFCSVGTASATEKKKVGGLVLNTLSRLVAVLGLVYKVDSKPIFGVSS